MSKGTIIRRGKTSWRLKYDLPRDQSGERRIAFKTVRGKRADAERELRALLHRQDKGIAIDPSNITIGEYLDGWLADVAPQTVGRKSLERYGGLIRNQIKPYLGDIQLQKLRPADIAGWHQELRTTELSTRSIRHAHGVLRTALAFATAIETIERNVATIIKAPAYKSKEVVILKSDEIADTLNKLEGHAIYPIVALAIGTGARRGEILALRWEDIDLDAPTVRIERSLEQTGEGIRVKATKTAAGRRTISLPAFTVEALRNHRRQQLEARMALGMGAPPADAPMFGDFEGNWPNPYSMSDRWRDLVKSRSLPKITFHALRHTHASILIADGLDVVAVSRQLGHESASFTLKTYSHLFENKNKKAAAAIDSALSK